MEYMEADADRINPELLKSIEGQKSELDRRRPFPPAVVRRLEEQFRLEWTYNSNAIEGNTLDLRETEMVLHHGVTIGKKSMKEHFEVLNHAKAIAELERFVASKRELTDDLILDLHRLMLTNIDNEDAGRFRQHNVRIMGAVHIPPQAIKVQRLVGELIAWYHSVRRTLPDTELAARVHHQIVHIHPFTDGNGRMARLVMNLLLMREGYSPAVILNVDRKRYYHTLQQADADKPGPFIDFIGRSVARSLNIYLNAMARSHETERHGYIPLSEAAERVPYSIEYLSYLARTHRLDAVKFGSKWMTTEEALQTYQEQHGTTQKSPTLEKKPREPRGSLER